MPLPQVWGCMHYARYFTHGLQISLRGEYSENRFPPGTVDDARAFNRFVASPFDENLTRLVDKATAITIIERMPKTLWGESSELGSAFKFPCYWRFTIKTPENPK